MAVFNKRLILTVSCSFFILFASCYVNGIEEEDILLTKEDEIDIENQLKLLNKPAIKTVETKHGDLYDCVDFYKQPAFDHPLLKNHSFHHKMRPSVPKTTKRQNAKSKNQEVKLTRIGCPDGTVPIRRITKDELVRAKLHEKKFDSKYPMFNSTPGLHHAFLETDGGEYTGGSAYISIYNLSIDNYFQYSLSRMSIHNGNDRIVVGAMTSRASCFNMHCAGFVLLNKDLPVDMRLDPVSQKGVRAIALKFNVYKANDENWWFELSESGTKLGFWPSSVFDGGLQDLATSIGWGGEVFGPVNFPSPPMGSGTLPVKDILQDGFCYSIKVRNQTQQEVEIYNATTYADTRVYNVIDKWVDTQFGHLIYFGGPGGYVGN